MRQDTCCTTFQPTEYALYVSWLYYFAVVNEFALYISTNFPFLNKQRTQNQTFLLI